MKKFFTLTTVAILIIAMSVTAFAADTGKIEAENSVIVNNYDPVQDKPDTNPDDGDEKVVGIKPLTDEPCTLTFTVNVDTAGTYTISVRYNAKSGKDPVRGIAMTVNESAVEIATENVHNDYNSYDVTTVEVSLNAGDNTIVLSSVADKSPVNVDWLAWKLKEAAPETPDEPVETPDEPVETPETPEEPEENAPQTGVAAILLSVTAVISGAYVVSKKR